MVITVKKAPHTAKSVKDGIIAYNEKTTTPTYRGLLVHLGLNGSKIYKLRVAVNDQDEEAEKIMDLLLLFKETLEAYIEELLIYQDRHPHLEKSKFVNYQSLQWMLKKSNPNIYGDKVEEEKTKIGAKTGEYVFNNSSGITLKND